MADAGEDPNEVVRPVEDRALLPNVVKTWKHGLELESVKVRVDILVVDGFGSEGERCEDHVVASDIVIIIDSLP